MIGIQNNKGAFSERWMAYCESKNIPYKVVDSYQNDIVEQLKDCDAFMWHHNHMHPKDLVFAKQLLFSLEHSGKFVFPDFKTAWHFDDKLGQKYLFESLEIPCVNSFVSYKKEEALQWAETTNYPKVFKLRGGGGSWNVFLVKNKTEAIRIIRKAFSSGFKQYDAWSNIKERWRKYRLGKCSFFGLLMGFVRVIYLPLYAKIIGRDMGYVYFQDFIPNNDSDIRVIVIQNKAFAIKRMVRADDFRASGSGNILYSKELFDEDTIKLSFEIARKLGGQSVALDFVYDNAVPKVVEVSYGFVQAGYDKCPGYWDGEMQWHEGFFDPCEWMVDLVVEKLNEKDLQK
jgi:glutathione synthase/RimK-type ligase-like ATP-grasp enzyme